MKRTWNYTAFGKQIKIRLIEMEMSNKDLARRLGMADSTVCDVISGRNNRKMTLERIAAILDITLNDYEMK